MVSGAGGGFSQRVEPPPGVRARRSASEVWRCIRWRTWREIRIDQKGWWWRSSECRWDEQESGCMLKPDRSWRRSGNLIVGDSSHGCDGQDSGLEWNECSALWSLRRTPAIVLLRQDEKCGDQELSERRAVPSRNMASNSAFAIASLSGASRRGRQATGGSGVNLNLYRFLLLRVLKAMGMSEFLNSFLIVLLTGP
jgi:hypothetical protein